jgi:hypothetical protein
MSHTQPVALHEFTIPEQMLWDALCMVLRAPVGTPAWVDAVDAAHLTMNDVCMIPQVSASVRVVCQNALSTPPPPPSL